MHITLVRHGETEWNRTGRAQGHQPTPLNDAGRQQAERLTDALRDELFDVVWSSDLARAIETITPWATATGHPVIAREDLRERSFGDWEGTSYLEVMKSMAEIAHQAGKHESEVRPPNGESYEDVFHRVGPLVDELSNHDGRILIVSHGGTLGCLMARLFRGTPQSASSFRFRNAAIAEIIRRPNGDFALERYNDTRHL
jgi:broad specificity phosphatase PhoE